MAMNKRAIYYVIDALVCMSILVSAILLFSSPPSAEISTQHQSLFWSTDIIGVLLKP